MKPLQILTMIILGVVYIATAVGLWHHPDPRLAVKVFRDVLGFLLFSAGTLLLCAGVVIAWPAIKSKIYGIYLRILRWFYSSKLLWKAKSLIPKHWITSFLGTVAIVIALWSMHDTYVPTNTLKFNFLHVWPGQLALLFAGWGLLHAADGRHIK